MKGNFAAEGEQLPPFAEQMAQQLGGWRGLIESGIPVAVFVLVNNATDDTYWKAREFSGVHERTHRDVEYSLHAFINLLWASSCRAALLVLVVCFWSRSSMSSSTPLIRPSSLLDVLRSCLMSTAAS